MGECSGGEFSGTTLLAIAIFLCTDSRFLTDNDEQAWGGGGIKEIHIKLHYYLQEPKPTS